MKAYVFEVESGTKYYIIARDFNQACKCFDNNGVDPRTILSMLEYTPSRYT